ncbi:MAG: class I SAM-dependent methyltransferase [Phycisphaerales bacterium]
MASPARKGLLFRVRREVRRVGVQVGLLQPYQPEFFAGFSEASRASARVVLPLVRSWLNPASVVDVGCGTGGWLAVWLELGVENVRGIDGDYVLPEQLEIPHNQFTTADVAAPISMSERFDLAMCLEVAEHLPPAAGETLVASLAGLADAILFSAAVPGQGGTGHVHERWPDYWAGLFAAHGFVVVDAVRPVIWADERVSWWYRQNTLLFLRPERLAACVELAGIAARRAGSPLCIAQPYMVERLARRK